MPPRTAQDLVPAPPPYVPSYQVATMGAPVAEPANPFDSGWDEQSQQATSSNPFDSGWDTAADKPQPQAAAKRAPLQQKSLTKPATSSAPVKTGISNGYAGVKGFPGLMVEGNIDLSNRPIVDNPDGSYGTEYSGSFNDGMHEVLLPTIFDGKHHTMDEAIKRYEKTGEHMGKFATGDINNIDAYAEKLHSRKIYVDGQEYHGKGSKRPTVTMGAGKPTSPAKPVEPKKNAFEEAGGDIAQGVGAVYGAAKGIPILGDALQSTENLVTGAAKDYRHNPATAAVATAAGVPAGVIGLLDDIENLKLQATRKVMPPQVQAALGLVKEAGGPDLTMAPVNRKEDYYGAPVIKRFAQPNRGAAALGEVLGGAALPLGPLGRAASLAGAAGKGALVGAGFGALGQAGESARRDQKQDIGKIARAGASTALIGGALGAGAHALGGKPKAAEQAEPKGEEPKVTLPDGRKIDMKSAGALIDDPHIPAETKQSLIAQIVEAQKKLSEGHGEPAKPKQETPSDKQQIVAGAREPAPYSRGPERPNFTLEKKLPAPIPRSTEVAIRQPLGLPGPTQQPLALPYAIRLGYDPNLGMSPPSPPSAGLPSAPEAGAAEIPVPLNSTGSTLPAPASSQAPGRLPAELQNEVKAAPEAESLPATTGGAKNLEKIDSTPKTTEMGAKARYVAIASEKGKGYHDVLDTETNSVQSSSKRSLAQATAVADKLNAGTLKPTKGHRSKAEFEREATQYQKDVIAGGQEIENRPDTGESLQQLGDAKNAYDESRANYEAAFQQWRINKGNKPALGQSKARLYNKEVENEFAQYIKSQPEAMSLEVNSAAAIKPRSYKFKSNDVQAQAEEVRQLYNKQKAAEEALRSHPARELIKGKMSTGELPYSINVAHPKGMVNVRAVDRARILKDELGPDVETFAGHIREVDSYLKTLGKRFLKEETGAVPTQNLPGYQLAESLALKGLKKLDEKVYQKQAELTQEEPGKISESQHRMQQIGNFFDLKRTFDHLYERSKEAHDEVTKGVAREVFYGRGIKFKPSEEELIHRSMKLDPESVLLGEEGLDKLPFRKREYLAQRRIIRNKSADIVGNELTEMEMELGKESQMSAHDQLVYHALTRLYNDLMGNYDPIGPIERGFHAATGTLYDLVFKWNPAYHGLVLTHTGVIGAGRVGLGRYMAAKYIQLADPQIRKYIGDFQTKSPLQQLRHEMKGGELPSNVKRTALEEKYRKFADWRDSIPDLPGERWSFNDMVTAGMLEHADKIKYPGGGYKMLKDMAAGKLSAEQQVEALVDGLSASQDTTHSGMLGLDKDLMQRSPILRMVAQFASQNFRVARLLTRWTGEAAKGDLESAKKIATFAGLTTLIGGRAVLPRELDALEYGPKPLRAILHFAQDYADKAAIIGHMLPRELTEKIRFSFTPLLGSAQTNILASEMANLVQFAQGDGKSSEKALKAAMWLALSKVFGGGGAEMAKLAKAGENLKKGDKDVYAFKPLSPFGVFDRGHPIDKTTFSKLTGKKYGLGDAAMDQFTGVKKQEGEFAFRAQRKWSDKRK